MRTEFTRVLIGCALVLAVIWSQSLAGQPLPRAGHLLIIGVDGMSPNGVQHAHTPVMHRLMKEGSFTLHARDVLPSSSSSNWASMIMGVGPEMHGITSNDWERDEQPLPPVLTGTEEIFPTIFGVLRQARPKSEIGAVYHWDGFGRLFERSAVNYDVHESTEEKTAAAASNYLIDKKPTFLFVHLDHVDGAGHEFGHGTPEYYAAVAKADSLIGVILAATVKAGIASDLTVIISADHGGMGRGHGGESLAETEIPFIIYGKGIRKGVELRQPVYIYDIAATAAFVTGVTPPYAWTGRPVLSAFEGEHLPTADVFSIPLPVPVFVPAPEGFFPAGALSVEQPARVEIKYDGPHATIRYTLDGSIPSSASQPYTQPFTLDKGGIVKARAFAEDGGKSRTAMACFRVAKKGNGLSYSYYEGEEWDRLPNFSVLTPVRTGTALEFRLDQIGARHEHFAVVMEGFLKIEKEGKYDFYTVSDDGSCLFVNGKQVVNNDGNHGPKEKSGDIVLQPGLVPIRALYYNSGGGAWLDVLFKGPGIPKQIVQAGLLFPSNK